MDTNWNNVQAIRATFSVLFENRTDQERRDDAAQLLSFRFMSEVERIMDERGMTKHDLAEALGTSTGHITQLFRGNRILNFDMFARLEKALSVNFTINSR
ncbi:helix-turn-helix transcriptional regulator [Rudanella lutea]|uniref:helix-turn-helix transcriptional regulator n=1 Tax=Rudanella lutea TaxID=451374 RepID=UPI0012FC8894|nr:helix-turn-helix transcriptional regulator [Rudanella lutea]